MTGIPAAAAPAGSIRVGVAFRGRDGTGESDLVSVEEPLEIRLAYRDAETGEAIERGISVTMRTPGNDVELALGFLFGEGVIAAPADVESAAPCGPPSPDKGIVNTVKVSLRPGVRFDAEHLSRHVFTTSSCGVCGKTSLDAVRAQIPGAAAPRPPLRIHGETLRRLPAALRAAQTEFDRTGGIHASASFDARGALRRLREDVGRHNALDKLIGAGIAAGESPLLAGCGVLLSGRASFELVQKTAMTRAALIAAIGPPSSLAVELAADQDITLVGFLKARTFNIYTGAQRIIGT